MTGRTGPPAATKRTSAFAHAIVVWLRRNVLLEWLTHIAGKTHASTGTLFCMEWRATRLRWCKNGTMRCRECPAYQLIRYGSGKEDVKSVQSRRAVDLGAV